VQVQYLDGDGGSAYPDELIQLLENPDLATTPTVPDYVSEQISSIREGTGTRTLWAWKEAGTSKFAVWLRSSEKVLGMAATTEFVGDETFLSIHRRCGPSAGVVWGTVPANVAAIELGLVAPDRIETIAGPSQLGDVRFVLGGFTEPYPEGAPVTFIDAAGKPLGIAWPSAPKGCLE
jgi:hypothetical protein